VFIAVAFRVYKCVGMAGFSECLIERVWFLSIIELSWVLVSVGLLVGVCLVSCEQSSISSSDLVGLVFSVVVAWVSWDWRRGVAWMQEWFVGDSL